MDLREESSDGAEFITIGKMDICRIARLLHHKHNLQSKVKTAKLIGNENLLELNLLNSSSNFLISSSFFYFFN